jgi:anti-anti-sigma regulatory factor
MMKITKNNDDGVTTLKLEGKLTGEWVSELRDSWRRVALNGDGRAIRVDLTSVTWISEEGRDLLGEMQRGGAELLAANLLMAGIVAEICGDASG